ncbi:MAG TPA: isochorismatase family cysteine hydrolase [Oscillatoriaceae cyanobacterium]
MLEIEAARSALLVMDFQTAIVENFSTDREGLLERTAGLLRVARASGVQVIYVVVGFRPGFPEISPNNLTFSQIKQSGRFSMPASPEQSIHPAVAAQEGDIVVVKHRVSAFFGTDLDMILRANGIETLIMGGIATSGVVLSTLRHAADADYRVIVVEDCCSDRDPEVHACLVGKVFPRQATITQAAALEPALKKGASV